MKASIFLQIRLLLLGSLLGGIATTLPAQKVCQETAVYFASGKSSLTPQATQRLDSLIALWGNAEVHLELEGHTDSINPPSVNLQLSEDRIATVNHYLTQNSKARLSTQVRPQGENDPRDNNGSEQGKANNRRVEIQYVLLQNGNFTFTGQRGSAMSLPTSAITECSVCNTNFSLEYLGSDAAIAAAGIGMQTVDGGLLTTGGMVVPSMGCGKAPRRAPGDRHVCDTINSVTFTFPIQTADSGFSAWVSNPVGLWEPNTTYSIIGNTIRMTVNGFCWCRRLNWDKRLLRKKYGVVNDASNLKILRSSIALPVRPQPRQFQPGNAYPYDSLTRATYKSFAEDADGQLWICSQTVDGLANGDTWLRLDTLFQKKVVMLRDYRPLTFSDTLQRIQVKRKLNVTAISYYVKEADTTFAFTQLDKRTFEAPKLNYQHVLVFKKGTGKGKGIQKDPKRIPTKYKARRQRFVGKVKKL